ncbi:MAG: universal stress protein [Planctomycetes bacterium]|nr:universal stress protein [Planctomycetota bacterium]
MARVKVSDLYLVVAYEPLPLDLGEPFLQEILTTRMIQAEKIFNTALQECGDIQGRLIKEILEGPPAEAILSVAVTREADLIIMGTRGLGRIASLFLGSQSMKVVAEAQCPVMLVH